MKSEMRKAFQFPVAESLGEQRQGKQSHQASEKVMPNGPRLTNLLTGAAVLNSRAAMMVSMRG
jgi:hypothetical protein